MANGNKKAGYKTYWEYNPMLLKRYIGQGVTQEVKCLPSICKAQGSIPSAERSTQKVFSMGLEVWLK
jgi:hypothetical protein